MEPEVSAILGSIREELGEMRGEMKGFRQDLTALCAFKDIVTKITTTFENYAASRKDLPEKLQDVDSRVSVIETAFASHCTLGTEESSRLRILWEEYTKYRGVQAFLTGLSALFSFILILIVIFHEKLGLTFTLS